MAIALTFFLVFFDTLTSPQYSPQLVIWARRNERFDVIIDFSRLVFHSFFLLLIPKTKAHFLRL